MIIINMLFSCFRGAPIQLASSDHIKPQHVCCAVVRHSVHYKCMQKKENGRKSSRFISNSEFCHDSISVRCSRAASVTGVTVTSPARRTLDTCQHQAKGRGSLPRSCTLLISLGDSNDLLPILWVEVNGDSNILMPKLRVEDDFVNVISHVTYSPVPVDLSGDIFYYLYDISSLRLRNLGIVRTGGSWLLIAGGPGLRHHSNAPPSGIAHSDLAAMVTAGVTSGFIHCLQIVECDYQEEFQLTDHDSHTCYDLYQNLDLYLVTGIPLSDDSVKPA